jgi:hypothetical protein
MLDDVDQLFILDLTYIELYHVLIFNLIFHGQNDNKVCM